MRENKIIIVLLFFTLILGIYASFVAFEENLKEILVTLAQLNVAIAVGIGAISISYSKDRALQSKLTESTIIIIFLCLITFLLAHLDGLLLAKRLYLFVNIISVCGVIIWSRPRNVRNN